MARERRTVVPRGARVSFVACPRRDGEWHVVVDGESAGRVVLGLSGLYAYTPDVRLRRVRTISTYKFETPEAAARALIEHHNSVAADFEQIVRALVAPVQRA